MSDNNNKAIVGAALTGLVAGVIAGILLAPKSGKETRRDLMQVAERMKGDITDRLRKLSRITKKAYDEIVHTVVTQYQEAKKITADQAEELREELAEGYDEVKSSIDQHSTNNLESTLKTEVKD